MSEVKWIKLNVDMFDDEKIKIIQAMPDGDALLVVWIKLIVLAGKTNDGGYVYISEDIPYTEEMLAVIMNKPLTTIKLAMDTFVKLGMLENDTKGIYLLNFEKHQSLDKLEKIREQNRLRKQKEREQKKLAESNVTLMSRNVTLNVTQCHATDIDIEEEIEKDTEIEVNRENTTFPTLQQIKDYVAEHKLNVDSNRFFSYYNKTNWKTTKGNPIEWQDKLQEWNDTEIKKEDSKPQKSSNPFLNAIKNGEV